MALNITSYKEGDCLRVAVAGEVDVSCADELRSALSAIPGQDVHDVVVDLAEVPYIDSTGIGVLVGAARRARQDNVSFTLANPQRNVGRVLTLLGVSAELGVEEA